MAHDFFRTLSPFHSFEQVSEEKWFHPAPKDWILIVADIVDSTDAISKGRYKEVNLVGAACIACLSQIDNERGMAFVFGGDGATILIAPEFSDRARMEFLALKNWSLAEFGLELRVGFVPVQELYQRGASLRVGKLELNEGNCTAHFKGGGHTLAETLVKRGEFLLSHSGSDKVGHPFLEGLSCRLDPLYPKADWIVSLLVRPQIEDRSDEIIAEVLSKVQSLRGGQSLSPVSAQQLKWSLPIKLQKIEAKLRPQSRSLWGRIRTFGLCLRDYAFLKSSLSVAKKYRSDLIANTDSQKLDDTLRMILDCSEDQVNSIEAFLQEKQKAGELIYGTHKSSHALMTCLVHSVSGNEHVHFIDGGEGGYALAAKKMKAGSPLA